MTMEPIQVVTTSSAREEAERIARTLVERRLAACVQIIGPIGSVYRWQDQVEQAEEWLCLIKSTQPAYAAIESAICELHSYECPEVIVVPIAGGSEDYLQWLAGQVA